MDKKQGIIKALMSDLGVKTLKIRSKDRSSTTGDQENRQCAATSTPPLVTQFKTLGDDSSTTGAASPLSDAGTETESESEDDVPPASDAQTDIDYSRWKTDINFLINEDDD